MSKDRKLALVFSGGGSRGGYEIGVWQAMKELGMDIDIVTGTSVGAINAAMVCVGELELAKKLWHDVETNMIFDLDNESRYNEAKDEIIRNTRGFMGMPVAEALSYAKYTVTRGGAGSTGMLSIVNDNLDLDAFYSSPVEYGLVTAELPLFKGHYLFKEDIPREKLCEYLVASASCFPAAHYTLIDGMKLVDGGYSDNLPIDMAMEKGATEMVAINMEAVGVVKKDSLRRAEEELDSFTYITSKWDLGNFLCFDPETNRRNMTLGYFDGLKAFGVRDGIWYTFEKGSLPSKSIRRADSAARVFGLYPLVAYTRESLDMELAPRIQTMRAAYRKKKELLEKRAARLLSGSITSGIAGTIGGSLSPEELAVYIAYDFKEKEGASAFLNKSFISRFGKEVLAASYIKGEGLI